MQILNGLLRDTKENREFFYQLGVSIRMQHKMCMKLKLYVSLAHF